MPPADDKKKKEEEQTKTSVNEQGQVHSMREDKASGITTTSVALNQEEADKAAAKGKNQPSFENQQQALNRTPGNVDLTQGGTLAGDKSVRDNRSIEDLNKEQEEKSGPNPFPNREGNEITKMEQAVASSVGVSATASIDSKTNQIADRLEKLRDNLDKKGEKELDEIQKELRQTGKF